MVAGCSIADELFDSFQQLLTLADRKGVVYDRCVVSRQSLLLDCFSAVGALYHVLRMFRDTAWCRFVLENSGVAEPQKIRDKFSDAIAEGHALMSRIQLDTMVTVVDSGSFTADYSSRTPAAGLYNCVEYVMRLRSIHDCTCNSDRTFDNTSAKTYLWTRQLDLHHALLKAELSFHNVVVLTHCMPCLSQVLRCICLQSVHVLHIAGQISVDVALLCFLCRCSIDLFGSNADCCQSTSAQFQCG